MPFHDLLGHPESQPGADILLGAVREDVRHLTGGLTVFPMALLIGLRLIPLGLLVARILRQLTARPVIVVSP